MPAAPTPGPGLETTFTTPKDEVITVRPMRATDGDGLLEFFHRIPVEDRLYLREDVTDARVVQGWIEKLDYRRVLPLIALAGERIVGDATLHRSGHERPRVAQLRILIDPAYRNLGLGRFLLKRLVDIATNDDHELDTIALEIVSDSEQAAQHAARALGFVEAHDYAHYIHFYSGKPHDLVVMELQVRPGASADLAEPAQYMF